jgi:hypothetical protein
MFETVNNGGAGAQETAGAAGATPQDTDYTIVEDDTSSGLSSKVNNLLARGWEPAGGVSVSHYRENPEDAEQELWAQALVRRPGAA